MFRFGSRLRAYRTVSYVRGGHRCMSKEIDRADRKILGPVTFFGLGFAALVGGAAVALYYVEKDQKTKALSRQIKTVGKPALGGPWSLVDQDGYAVTDATFRGAFTILYFGFTYCPDICPSELVKVGKIMDGLEKKGVKNVIPLFISVDPKRDTVGQMKHYSQDFHPSIVYLTGTPDQVAKATKAYRVYFSKANENDKDEEDYLVDHSIVLYLVSPDGQFLDFFTQSMQPSEVVEKVQHWMNEYDKAKAEREAATGKKEVVVGRKGSP